MIWVLIILLGVGADQLTKQLVTRNIPYGEMVPVLDPLFFLTNHANKGAAWGILQNQRILFIALTSVVLIIIGYIAYKSQNKLLKFSLSVIMAGALGNYIDRVFRGGVTDFLDFYFGSYHFPTFNVADSLIVVGTGLLAYYLLFVYKEPEKVINAETNEITKDEIKNTTEGQDGDRL